MSIAAAEIRLDKRVTRFVKERRKLLIDGQWVEAASGKTFPVQNPATGEVITRVTLADAVDASRAAYEMAGIGPALHPEEDPPAPSRVPR